MRVMVDFDNCHACGSEITDLRRRFLTGDPDCAVRSATCPHCGASLTVERSEVFTIAPVVGPKGER